jgi:hypothetical protein
MKRDFAQRQIRLDRCDVDLPQQQSLDNSDVRVVGPAGHLVAR